MTPPRTVVVGAGIAGAAVALALRRRDRPVVVLERVRPGAGATGASGGMLAPQYEVEETGPLLRLGMQARAAWPEFAERVKALAGRRVEVRRLGMLVAYRGADARERAEAAVSRQREMGLTARALPPDRAAALQPGLAEAGAWLWLPEEGRVNARSLAAALGPALRASGADLRTGAEVTALLATGGAVRGVVLADGREVPGDRVVLACGAWSATLEGLPRPIPVRPVRGQMLRFAPFDREGVEAPRVRRLVADPFGRYLVPLEDGSVLAGSTMEEAGYEARVTEKGRRAIHEAAARLVPALGRIDPTESWAGLRPVSVDDLPVLGPDPELQGLYWATGYGRNGILLAPRVGELLARRMLDEPEADGKHPADGEAEALAPFRADRFDASLRSAPTR